MTKAQVRKEGVRGTLFASSDAGRTKAIDGRRRELGMDEITIKGVCPAQKERAREAWEACKR